MPASVDSRAKSRRSFLGKLLLLLPILAALSLYRIAGHLARNAWDAWIVKWPIDDQIPFVTSFVYAYCFWYFYTYGTVLFLLLRRGAERIYRRFTLSMTLTLVLAVIVFFLFPTHIDRPVVVGGSLADQLVRAIFRIDPPYNCLPSIHVAFSVLTCIEWDRWLRGAHPVTSGLFRSARFSLRVANIAVAVLICLSTLFIKQHYSPDLAGGIAVALIALLVVSIVTGDLRRGTVSRA